jgi:UDP-N-acetylglucosamine--N-acetylmuramyl-(pentapeptide) pyrophosphoryl-undecaprenol N-acetylglucosamine transferase
MEREIVATESDLPYHALPAAALRGRAPWTAARNLATLARGIRTALRLIAAERPGAILGTGGYVCVPLFLAARVARVPTMIYLPDVVPGLAVRFLARLSTAVAGNVADSAVYLGLRVDDLRQRYVQLDRGVVQSAIVFSQRAVKRKLFVVGYPVRPELVGQDRPTCRAAFGLALDVPVLLVYGGSRGARSINQVVAELLGKLLELAQVIHVCGREGDEQFLRDAADRLPAAQRERYRLYPYLHGGQEPSNGPPGSRLPNPSMVQAFGAADLALCRSGASTLAELPAAGLPAVLVPYPYVHQDENADYLVRYGAVVKVHDTEMRGDGRPEDGPLFRQVRHLLTDERERNAMAERSRALAQPDAAHRLAALLLDLAARRVPHDRH